MSNSGLEKISKRRSRNREVGYKSMQQYGKPTSKQRLRRQQTEEQRVRKKR